MIYCPKCKTECSDAAARCISCGASLSRGGTTRIGANPNAVAGPAAAATGMSRPLAWTLAAGSTVVAALIWVGLSRATDMRLGFLIIGVAIAVGSTIGYSLDARREIQDGIIAVVLTLAGLFLAKAVLTSLLIGDVRAEIIAETRTDEAMIERLLSSIPEDQIDDAMEVPAAVETVAQEHGVAPHHWAAAQAKWQQMAQSERDAARKAAVSEALSGFEDIEGAWLGLGTFFGSLTGLGSTIIAVGIAWTLGSGVNRKQAA